jgi:hypothetical protein
MIPGLRHDRTAALLTAADQAHEPRVPLSSRLTPG